MEQQTMDRLTRVLERELQVATGCTEPIAIAFCAAYAASVLGGCPARCQVGCSGNIIKNAKSVAVPGTGGLRGIEAAVLAGALGGDHRRGLDVIGSLDEEACARIAGAMGRDRVTVELLDSPHPLHIVVEAWLGEDSALVEVLDSHTNVVRVERNGELLALEQGQAGVAGEEGEDFSITIEEIYRYADGVDLEPLRPLLERQIAYNERIAREGLSGEWGAAVGRTLLEQSDSLHSRMQALAAAGSDARMNGCAMPVVVNCGSGNQGITSSLPLLEYARSKEAPRDRLLRAICVSNIVALRQKAAIGKLSAYCGAVGSAAGCAAAMAYLDGLSSQVAGDAVVNTIATVGGMVCDGAKSSCAAKIATAVGCACMAYGMARQGRAFQEGEGLVKGSAEATIDSVSRMAAQGMRGTDREILRIMLEQ